MDGNTDGAADHRGGAPARHRSAAVRAAAFRPSDQMRSRL
jgi:hypothetical protein